MGYVFICDCIHGEMIYVFVCDCIYDRERARENICSRERV